MVRDGDDVARGQLGRGVRAAAPSCSRPVIAEHGIEAVTAYVGNPLAHNFSLGRYVGILIGMSGIPMIYSAGTVDQWPKNVSSHLMYGGMWKIPVPDIQRTDLLVVMGANPQASQGSLLACPDVMGEIDAHPGARRQGRRRSTRARTGTADEGRRVAADHARHRRRAAARGRASRVRRGPGATSARVADLVDGRRRARGARRRLDARAGRARSPASPAERIRALAHELADDRAGRRLRPHRPLQPGVRHARQLAGRRREHPHRPLRRRAAG